MILVMMKVSVRAGYDVLLWIEEHVIRYGYVPPKTIDVHSSNSSARTKMLLAICAIQTYARNGNSDKG